MVVVVVGRGSGIVFYTYTRRDLWENTLACSSPSPEGHLVNVYLRGRYAMLTSYYVGLNWLEPELFVL